MPFYCSKRSAGICVVLGPENIFNYSSEYASGFKPTASHCRHLLFPRNEGLFGQISSPDFHERLLQRPILLPGVALSRSVSSTDRKGSRYQETAGSPSRRRAQTCRALFIAPCALREAPAGFGLSRFATPFMKNPG
jgi:hypothetical protein